MVLGSGPDVREDLDSLDVVYKDPEAELDGEIELDVDPEVEIGVDWGKRVKLDKDEIKGLFVGEDKGERNGGLM